LIREENCLPLHFLDSVDESHFTVGRQPSVLGESQVKPLSLRRMNILFLCFFPVAICYGQQNGPQTVSRGEPSRRSLPSLNFHNTRARRKPGDHVQTA
jgi:hypothetical protein